MQTRIRVLTRAESFEQRKQQCTNRGYRIEGEQPVPVNGLCSFVAVRDAAGCDPVDELVAQALDGKSRSRHGITRQEPVSQPKP
jgi:hypothetical protein